MHYRKRRDERKPPLCCLCVTGLWGVCESSDRKRKNRPLSYLFKCQIQSCLQGETGRKRGRRAATTGTLRFHKPSSFSFLFVNSHTLLYRHGHTTKASRRREGRMRKFEGDRGGSGDEKTRMCCLLHTEKTKYASSSEHVSKWAVNATNQVMSLDLKDTASKWGWQTGRDPASLRRRINSGHMRRWIDKPSST